ncbi:MAG: T9SS type A sorting domain-containing protein [Ignavibacteriae bacterium]|nr:T9SS type A sorting domain-containing protein [Ignavibacteriota bacterium]
MRTSSLSSTFVVFTLLWLCIGSQSGNLHAQPKLRVMRIINNWPTIEVYIRSTCNGERIFPSNSKQFRISENGRDIRDFELWCPEPTTRDPLTCVILLDVDPRMDANAQRLMKQRARELISSLDLKRDNATILAVSATPSVVQSKTSDTTLLFAAVESVQPAATARLWDGLFQAMDLLHAERLYPAAVYYFGSGRDSASQKTPGDCLQHLWALWRTMLYSFTFGTPHAHDSLRILTERSSGRDLHNPAAGWMQTAVTEAATIVSRWIEDCLITYQATCMDRTERIVRVTLLDTCNGTDTEVKSYRAPVDTSTFTPLRVGPGTVFHALEGSVVEVPVLLHDYPSAYPGNLVGACTFSILFNDTLLSWRGADIPEGSIYSGVPVRTTLDEGRVIIYLDGPATAWPQTMPTTLLLLRFRVRTAQDRSVVRTPVHLVDWKFHEGCHSAWTRDGAVLIPQRRPAPVHTLAINGQSIRWDEALARYTPSPLQFSCLVANNGAETARHAMVTLSFTDSLITPTAPRFLHTATSPPNIEFNTVSEARWDLFLHPRTTGDTVLLSAEMIFDNADTLRGSLKLWIPPARVTGIDVAEKAAARLFSVYPNPSDGFVTLRFPDTDATYPVSVHDALGRLVYTVTSAQHGSNTLDLSAVPPGLYIINAGGFRQTLLLTR